MPDLVICEAVRELRLVEFGYEDSDGNFHHRIVEPYVYGRTSGGEDALRGYQVGGTSENRLPGWRLFRRDRMTSLRRTATPFQGTAPGYAHGDSALSPIYCRVP